MAQPGPAAHAGTVACIDIGKTHKRVAVFDAGLRLIDEVVESIPEIEGPAGIRVEDIEAIEEFTDGALAELARRHRIHALGVSTHAGTWVGLNRDGRRSLPVVAYTNDLAEAESNALVTELGGEAALYLTTATPRLPAFVNMGLGVAFAARHFSRDFAQTARILNFPQYLGHRLTGASAIERTYLGCHTYLWNFAADTYSDFARVVGYAERAPGTPLPTRSLIRPLAPQTAQRLGLSGDVVVHLGVHDSNAALAAAMAQGTAVRPIGADSAARAQSGNRGATDLYTGGRVSAGQARETALLSTGTWCVAMAPGDGHLTAADLDRGILLNMDVDGQPVRTSIYRAGGLYAELRSAVIRRSESLGGNDPDGGTGCIGRSSATGGAGRRGGASRMAATDGAHGPDAPAEDAATAAREDLIEARLQETGYPRVILPATSSLEAVRVELSADRTLSFADALEATASEPAYRDLWLAALGRAFAQAAWAQLTDIGIAGRRRLVIEGGFRRNRSYLRALSRLADGTEVVAAPDEQGSARGGALLAMGPGRPTELPRQLPRRRTPRYP